MRRIRLTQAVLIGSATVVGGLVGLATNAASADQDPWPGPLRWVHNNPWWAMAVLVGVGIVVAVGMDVRSRGDRIDVDNELTLAEVTNQLAVAVGRQWQNEARMRRLYDPHPLPVAWHSADLDLIEPWDALCVTASGWPGGPPTDPAGWAASPAELAGTDNDLADRLGKIPTGRLIVLGEPGTGKTMLLVRLVLELLARRHPGGPVPVLVSLAGWNPIDQDLWTWLAARLTVDHPGLAERAPPQDGATSRARMLWEQGLLLPILDGLDELPEGAWSRAVTRLNDALIPRQGLVLASRTAAYRQAVAPAAGLTVRLWGAAGISLRPVAPDDVRTYLRRDAASPATAARWDPILDTLGTSAPVAQALTTPLLIGLARSIYNPRPRELIDALPDPAELCDTTRFPTSVKIQEHLFDAFIPAAYRPHPDPARRSPWTPRQAERWLMFLARHLEHDHQGKTDFAWWELHQAVSSRMLGVVVGLVVGLVVGVVGGVVNGLVFGVVGGLGVGVVGGVVVGVAVAVGLAFGLVFGGLGGVTVELAARPGRVTTPAGGLGWKPPGRSELLFSLVSGVGVALVVGLMLGLVFEPAFGLIGGLAGGLVVGLMGALVGMPTDLTVATEPRAALVRDRTTYWSLVLAVGLAFALGLVGGLVVGLMVGLVGGLALGLAVGLALGLTISHYDTAWGAFVFSRCWLALRRRLPWRLMSFLTDAHQQRGVLRQAGAVYQFRHVDLQRRLARQTE